MVPWCGTMTNMAVRMTAGEESLPWNSSSEFTHLSLSRNQSRARERDNWDELRF